MLIKKTLAAQVAGGKVLAGVRVIPLVIEEAKFERAVRICSRRQPLIEVLPYRSFNVGIVENRERGLPRLDQGCIRSRRS